MAEADSGTPVALVTGGGRGLGAAIATRLARDGFRVVVNYRGNVAAADELVDQLRSEGLLAAAYQADVADPQRVAEMFAELDLAYGRLDVLVNNAGINRDGAFLEMSLADWDAVMATHLRGAFVCCQHAARLMLRGGGGAIVNMGSTTGLTGRINGSNYCPAKAGLMVLTRCLALELAPTIRVNTVVPGLIPTDETVERYRLDDPDTVAFQADRVPLKRLGSSDEVAAAVAFLCGEQASFITGQTLPVTGGQFMNH